MMTQKQFCEAILYQARHEYQVLTNQELLEKAHLDSRICIAMDMLGEIPKERTDLKTYADEKSGILYVHVDEGTGKASFLTIRDMIDLLPD